MSIKIEPQTRLSIGADAINTGVLAHERGGLEADVSAYNGLIKISGGNTSAITDSSANWNAAYNHAVDNTQAHTDYLINDGNDSTSGTLAMATGSTIGNLTLGNGSIVDSSGAISFGDENLTTSGRWTIDAYNQISSLYSETDNVWGYNCIGDPNEGTKLNAVTGTGTVHPQAIIAGAGEGIRFLTMASNPGAGADILIATYEKMRIDPSGNLTLFSATSTLTGGTAFNIEAGASGIRSVTIYTDTTVSSANMYIHATPYQIARESSARKYKHKIRKLELDSSLIYDLQPVSFNSRCESDNKNIRFVGLIADEVEKIYPEIINYNENNEAENYDNRMLTTLLLTEIQNLNQRIIKLENK